jgi:outer membrane protein assembly factor BamA
MGSMKFGIELDTRNDLEDPTLGWYQSLLYEISRPGLGGNFDFQHVSLTVHRYNRLGKGKNLNMRFVGIMGSSGAPSQRGIHIHGVGGLRVFPDALTPFYRGFVSSVEARFDLGIRLRRTPLYRDEMTLLLFADVGGVEEKNNDVGMKVDGDVGIGLEGVGLLTYSGIFLGVRLDGGHPSARITFRVRRDF